MQTVHTQGEVEIGGLKLEYGSELRSCTVGWEILGEANLPVIVTIGGISAGRHVASGPKHLGKGWWEGFVGTGCAVDPAHYRVLAFDFLGELASRADRVMSVITRLRARVGFRRSLPPIRLRHLRVCWTGWELTESMPS